MTIHEAKNEGLEKLRRFDDEAAIDTEILLAHTLGISREELLAHDERKVPTLALRRFRALVVRRRKHEPVAYLIGHREFFGLQFEVNRHTLIPRPETELLVEETLAIVQSIDHGPRATGHALIIDVGTGSGAIAVTVAKNSNATVIATDISKQALKTAERNAVMNDVSDRIDFLRSDLLDFLHHKKTRPRNSVISVIVANLPYIPTSDWRKCMPDVKNFEPRSALDGGPDGLRVYDRLFHQLARIWPWTVALWPLASGASAAACEKFSRPTGACSRQSHPHTAASGTREMILICEIDPSQKKSFPKLVKKHFPKARIEIKNDLAGLPRVAIIEALRR